MQTQTLTTNELHNAIMKRSRCRKKFLKAKVKQTGEIIKFSETFVRNYRERPKNCTLIALIQKNLQKVQTFGELLFPFLQKKRQKLERLFLMKQKNVFLMIKKFAKFLITSFQSCLRLKNT